MTDNESKEEGHPHTRVVSVVFPGDSGGAAAPHDSGLDETKGHPPAAVSGLNTQQIFDAYRDKQRTLLQESDSVYGITSTFVTRTLQNENGQRVEKLYFERNATDATPLKKRIPPDINPRLIKNNTLLRVLGTLRGVSHVLDSLPEPNKGRATSDIARLKGKFDQFESDVDKLFDNANPKSPGRNPKKLEKTLLLLEEKYNLELLLTLKKIGS